MTAAFNAKERSQDAVLLSPGMFVVIKLMQSSSLLSSLTSVGAADGAMSVVVVGGRGVLHHGKNSRKIGMTQSHSKKVASGKMKKRGNVA